MRSHTLKWLTRWRVRLNSTATSPQRAAGVTRSLTVLEVQRASSVPRSHWLSLDCPCPGCRPQEHLPCAGTGLLSGSCRGSWVPHQAHGTGQKPAQFWVRPPSQPPSTRIRTESLGLAGDGGGQPVAVLTNFLAWGQCLSFRSHGPLAGTWDEGPCHTSLAGRCQECHGNEERPGTGRAQGGRPHSHTRASSYLWPCFREGSLREAA